MATEIITDEKILSMEVDQRSEMISWSFEYEVSKHFTQPTKQT